MTLLAAPPGRRRGALVAALLSAVLGWALVLWKDWHDALAASPELVAQLTEVGPPAC